MSAPTCKWIEPCDGPAVGAAELVTHCMTDRILVCRRHAGDAVGFGVRVVLLPAAGTSASLIEELERIRADVFVAGLLEIAGTGASHGRPRTPPADHEAVRGDIPADVEVPVLASTDGAS